MLLQVEVQKLVDLQLSTDEYFWLMWLYQPFSFPIQGFINYEKLYKLKYIDIDWEGDNPIGSTAKITEKGKEIFGELKDQSKVQNWIEEWRELFPAGIKQGGYNLRGDRAGCTKKMSLFMKEYPEFSKECIFEATKYYIATQKKDEFKYCQLAHYFIKKNDTSSLAGFCEEVLRAFKEKTKIKDIGKSDLEDDRL